jgi:hypothetical protein
VLSQTGLLTNKGISQEYGQEVSIFTQVFATLLPEKKRAQRCNHTEGVSLVLAT